MGFQISDLSNPEKGVITTIYGEAGTGKTCVCLVSLVNFALAGKKVAFVDTEGGFSPERIQQISGENSAKVMKNTFVFNPTTFEEQVKIINDLENMAKKDEIDFIIVDSIVMLYRLELGEKSQDINRTLSKQLAKLSSIARSKNIPILVTNQVYSWDGETKMVGGDLLKYWSKVLLQLEKTGLSRRKAVLIKHRSQAENQEVEFIIAKEGIRSPDKIKIFL